MATSLAAQLKKLAVPESEIYKEETKKASLLFDPKEAALKDRDTFYEIGRSGLNELIALNETFNVYADTLFNASSKDFNRAMENVEVNKNIDRTIEKFLCHLSPYLLLQPSHKALEWLINRYQIHKFNQDAIVALILPYHSTKIFVRIVQLLDIKDKKSKWEAFTQVQKTGHPLSNQALYNLCTSNPGIMQFIANRTLKYVNIYGERANQLNTVFAFFCQTTIGTINNMKKVKDSIINSILPVLIKAISSPIVDFRASAHIILGYLFVRTSFKKDTLDNIVDRLFTTEFDLTYDVTLLITILYNNQRHYNKISTTILNDLSIDTMNTMCSHLKVLIEKKNKVYPFVVAFLDSVLCMLQKDNEEFIRYAKLPQLLLDELDFKNQNLKDIIRCVLKQYNPSLSGLPITPAEDNDDVVIVEEEEQYFPRKVFNWYLALVKTLERQYPEAFDAVIKEVMDSSKNELNSNYLTELLGFKPAVAHKVGGAYLFENINHANHDKRVTAVKYVAKELHNIRKQDPDFFKESMLNRLLDDHPAVVNAALDLPEDVLEEILNEIEVTNVLTKLLAQKDDNWKPTIKKGIKVLCFLKVLPVNQDVLLAVLPHLFSHNGKTVVNSWAILKSPWAAKINLSCQDLGLLDSQKGHPEVINKAVFNTLFVQKNINFDQYLDESLLNKNSATDVCFYLLLKSCSFNKASVEEMTATLNLLMSSFENRDIVLSNGKEVFTFTIMPEFIENSREDKITFEFMEFIFRLLIENVNVSTIPKPWVNVCKTPEIILVRKLYEICITGCGIPSYSEKYAKLLKQLLDKFFKTPKEKFEFVANFACGHIFYASDPKNVIGPELQLRSIKLLNNLLPVLQVCEWMYDSDVVILMILFNLNNPVEVIRLTIIDTVSNILQKRPDNKLVYIRLMEEIIAHKQELILDHNQVSQVLTNVLTDKNPLTKVFRRNCFAKLTSIFNSKVPVHIKSYFVKLLSGLNNATTFPNIIIALKDLLNKIPKDDDNKLMFDIYESNLFRTAYSFINDTTVASFENKEVWSLIEKGLKAYQECVLEEDQTFISPSILIMKQFDEEVFNKVPKEKRKDLVRLFTQAGAVSNNPKISSMASKVMKKIFLSFADFKFIFDDMLNAVDPADNLPKKKKSTVSMLSYQLTETEEWRLGVAILEYVQTKKRMTLDTTFVSTLFNLLNKCLRFEEQSCVEYTKQLILSSLWYYCNKFTNENDKENMNLLKVAFKVELIIQCIRGTQNPQTHHHALLVLSKAAYMLPEQVLHHIMEIFTFMGSSVLRHDDAYSFQIITRIIETLIPILVKMEKSVKYLSEKELEELHRRAVPVLRIFADVVLHVPEHRRLPLYKKLIETLNPSQFLWVLIALLLEAHVAHFSENKKTDKRTSRTLADQEAPINRLDFGQSILLEFTPEIWLDCFVKLVFHVKSLPQQKDDNAMDSDVDPSEIFSVNGHTANQLRHYKYAIITFMNTCLSSSRFIQHNSLASNMTKMEANYKTLIINILTYIQSISKVSDEKTAKYWRVMLHHSYDLLDHTNNLLSAPMFLSVIRGLLKHNLHTVRRKSMELLNSKIQHEPEFLANEDRQLLLSLLQPLLDIVKTIENTDESVKETAAAQELELNQQTALLSLKLLTRMLAAENPESFKLVLETVTAYTCDCNISGNVMASVVLCLAELCGNLRAHALSSLRKFMPALIKVLKKQRKAETPELVLLSTVTAIAKIVESLPLFLSPYLQKILYEYSILLAKWQNSEQEQVSIVVSKLGNIKKKIAGAIPPRVLIPVVNETHQMLLAKENYDAIGPVMSVLAESFANVTTADFTALQQDLTQFFLNALQLRSDAAEKDINDSVIDNAEDEVVNALVSLVLKLSETSFRPFYFKIYDWAIRTNVEGKKDRSITFYRLSGAIADKLKGLFVLFAGHFIKNAADLLDACNKSKTEDLYFDSEDKCVNLIKYIIKTLHIVFLYDSQSFLNKDRFETLMQPVVDQLENTLGGISALKARAVEIIIPCVSQFAVATADDSLWKLLNYQILLKTRHNDGEIRLIALDCLVSMATQLGSSWLPLLAESVPFLAELLEDGDQKIETSTKDAIRKLEHILGEPLEKYF